MSILVMLVLSQTIQMHPPQDGFTEGPYATPQAKKDVSHMRCSGSVTCSKDGGLLDIAWEHGLTCSAGQALTSSGTGAMACTSTITASEVSCTSCVASSEIASVTGGQVSSAVATATALAGDPADCTAGQYATTISASGALTCAQVTTGQLGGTISDGQLASNYSGVGACGANTFASTLNDNAAPTCTQPAFSNLSGSATIGQGGTTETASTEDAVLVGASTTDWQAKVLPSCSNGTTSKLLYNSTTNEFSCGTDQSGGGAGSGKSFEQSVTLTAAGYFTQAVTLASTTATDKFVCRPFGTTADGLTPEVIGLAQLSVTASDLNAGVGLNINVMNPYGLEGTVRIHCTTGG